MDDDTHECMLCGQPMADASTFCSAACRARFDRSLAYSLHNMDKRCDCTACVLVRAVLSEAL